MRRTALLVACLALLGAPGAQAAPAAPPPTVAVTVAVAGLPAPKYGTNASWTVYNAGAVASLSVSSVNPPGATTTIDALWTSKEYRVYPKITAFQYSFNTTHAGLTTSSMPASVALGYRWRFSGKPWTPWHDKLQSYEATQGGLEGGEHLTFARPAGRTVQFQFRVHTELAAVGRETQMWNLLAFT